MTTLALVRPNELDRVKPLVMPLLSDACARSRKLDVSDVLGCIADGTMQLWCAIGPDVEAICVTELLQHPRRKTLRATILTGKDRANWLSHLETLVGYGAAHGCHGMDAWARPGWARILAPAGFKMTHVLLEKDFANG